MLPTIVAKVEDHLADETVYYNEMKSVQLLRELNDVEKLYLLKNDTSVSISEEDTNLKSANMFEVVEAALVTYIERGFIQGNLADFSMECEPRLYYSNTISNLSGIFWEIQMELSDEFGQNIYLHLDDQTGKLLLISYECLEPIYQNLYLDIFTKKEKYINHLFADYQAGMDFFAYDRTYGENHEDYYDAKQIIYTIGDVVYGEILIKFVLTDSGFSIYVE